jgi:uncharacterized protein (TIRG00374 family)
MNEPSMNSSESSERHSVGFFDPEHPLANIGNKVFIALSLLVGVILYYIARYSKGAEVLRVLAHTSPLYILGMLLVYGAYLVVQGSFFGRIYAMLGYKRDLPYLMSLYIGMNLVNTIAPVVGVSGTFYMMFLEHRNGISRSESLLMNFFYYMIDYFVFLCVLVGALLYLLIIDQITRTILVTSLIFALFVLVVGALGVFLLTHPTAFQSAIHFGNRILSRFTKKKVTTKARAKVDEFVNEAQQVWEKSRSSWAHIVKASGFAFMLHLSCIALLFLAFLALNVTPSFPILIAGYTVGSLLNIVSITPGGIGFAEGGMTAVFASLGVPVEQALLVSLLYRAVYVWFPLGVGLFIIHLLPKLASKQPARIV